jgi:hypothetical protein
MPTREGKILTTRKTIMLTAGAHLRPGSGDEADQTIGSGEQLIMTTQAMTNTGTEVVYVILPFTSKGGIDGPFYFRYYWSVDNTAAGDIVIECAIYPVADDESLAVTGATYIQVVDSTHETGDDLMVSAWSAAVALDSAWNADDLLIAVFRRPTADGSDTLSGTAALLAVELSYLETDAVGADPR